MYMADVKKTKGAKHIKIKGQKTKLSFQKKPNPKLHKTFIKVNLEIEQHL